MFLIVGLMLIFAVVNAPRAWRAWRVGKRIPAALLMVLVVLSLVIAVEGIVFTTSDRPPPARQYLSGSHDWSCARPGAACSSKR